MSPTVAYNPGSVIPAGGQLLYRLAPTPQKAPAGLSNDSAITDGAPCGRSTPIRQSASSHVAVSGGDPEKELRCPNIGGVFSIPATAVVRGGREGHGRSLDGRPDVDLPVPGSTGGSGARHQPGGAVRRKLCGLLSVRTVAGHDRPEAGRVRVPGHLPGRDWPDRARRVRPDRRTGPARASPDCGAGGRRDGPPTPALSVLQWHLRDVDVEHSAGGVLLAAAAKLEA